MNNPLVKFFLICSGASTDILDKQECFIEKNKYIGIGGTVFFTSVLASLSGGYAFYTIFESVITSCCFGLLWGLIIFNLDRLIVSSAKKKLIDASLSRMQKAELKFYELLSAFPRLLLAIVLAMVIATPLELKFFEKEIKLQIREDNRVSAIEIEDSLNQEFNEIEKLTEENKRLETTIKEKEKRRDQLSDEYRGEEDGTKGTRKRGVGPVSKGKKAELDKFEQELISFKNETHIRIEANEKRITKLIEDKDKKKDDEKSHLKRESGLLARIAALHKLIKNDDVLYWANFLINLLFILLEIAPIMVKLLLSRGPYDDIADMLEYTVYANEQKKISDLNDQINNDLILASKQNTIFLARASQLYDETVTNVNNLAQKELTEAQEEVAREIVNNWKAKALKTRSLYIKGQII